jgi:hypothetical protein
VARVRGEEAVRAAPRSLVEDGGWTEEAPPAAFDERLGDLPASYGDDTLVALARDPRTVFLYWDHAPATLAGAFEGLDHPHAQVWLFAQGAGWERERTIDFAFESRSYYLHDLEPGRTYRVELHAVDRRGRDRLVGHPSNPVTLPPVGPSPVVDDRVAHLPWAYPLPRLLGPGSPAGPISAIRRDLLAQLSDWTRHRPEPTAGTDHRGDRASSPGEPGPPSSPSGPYGGERP